MPCYGPLQAWKPAEGPIKFKEVRDAAPIQIRCGQCIGCRLEHSRQWAMRCLHESQVHEVSSFITLTYDDAHIPVDYSLRYRDFQLFMKRLRASFGSERQRRLSFFMCGEYGERTARPHYHACLFGIHFADREFYKRLGSGFNLYTSKALEKLWPSGFCSVADFSFETAAYVARYVVKKVTGAKSRFHYLRCPSCMAFGRIRLDTSSSCDGVVSEFCSACGSVCRPLVQEPEFTHMSLNPAIGKRWYEKYSAEVYPRDEVIVRGVRMKPPKYYDNLLEMNDADSFEFLEFERYKKSFVLAEDATPDRLCVREKVARAQLAFKRRTLE